MSSPIVSSLPAYVEQNRLPLLSASILGAKTIGLINLQTGIKGSAALNIISTAIELGEGGCGWEEAGSQTLTQRVLASGLIKVNMSYCDKSLIGTWAQYGVRLAAGMAKLPFEEEFTSQVVKHVNEAIDKAIWQGDTTSLNANLNKFDGFLKILAAEGSVITETIAAGNSYFKAAQQTLLAIPARCMKDDTVIFCGYDFLRAYAQELVEANLYHFNPGDSIDEIVIPGSSVKLIAVQGLDGTDTLVAGRTSNFVYGCDMESDKENFDLWYSADNREFRLAIDFNAGVQVAFPDEIVVADLSAGLASPISLNASLAKLAGTVNASDQIETHPNA